MRAVRPAATRNTPHAIHGRGPPVSTVLARAPAATMRRHTSASAGLLRGGNMIALPQRASYSAQPVLQGRQQPGSFYSRGTEAAATPQECRRSGLQSISTKVGEVGGPAFQPRLSVILKLLPPAVRGAGAGLERNRQSLSGRAYCRSNCRQACGLQGASKGPCPPRPHLFQEQKCSMLC